MKLNDSTVSAWHKFGFALTAITVVPAVGLVVASGELAAGLEFIGRFFLCVMLLVGGMVAYVARRLWLASRVTRHSMESEAHILLPQFDATTPRESRGRLAYQKVDTH